MKRKENWDWIDINAVWAAVGFIAGIAVTLFLMGVR